MKTEILLENNVLEVKLIGEIDHHSAAEIRNSIDVFIHLNHPQIVVFNFENIRFMDSSGIGLILGRYRLVAEYGGQINIINASPSIRKILLFAGIDDYINVVS